MKISHTAIIAVSMMLSATPAVAGDAAAGKATYTSKGCTGCHGATGRNENPLYPILAGQHAAYIKKNLNDFKSGARKDPTMNAMSGMLSDADIDNVAAYLSTQK